jgi:23S rRNA (uracil1939-C5)-methyltransferase
MSAREVDVAWLSERGEGTARVDGAVVSFPDALPGERLEITQERKRWRVARRVNDAPERGAPVCAIYGACGGCSVQHAAPAAQGRARVDLLRRALPEPVRAMEIRYVEAPAREGWRQRARMRWRVDGAEVSLGFLARASDRVVNAPQCPVLDPSLDAVLRALRACLVRIAPQGEVSLATGAGAPVVCVSPSRVPDAAGYAALEALLAQGFAGVAVRVPGVSSVMRFGDPRTVVPGFDGRPLVAGVDGFTQANAAVNAKLVATVAAAARCDAKDIFEFHAGAGNLTVALAGVARRVTALESDADAVASLRENLAARGITNVTVRHDADEVVRGPVRAEVVVLDPPRTGARAVAENLAKNPVRRVVYVSCDPATLGRDLGLLSGAYAVTALTAFEMFPHTLHVETVAVLERRGGAVLRSAR